MPVPKSFLEETMLGLSSECRTAAYQSDGTSGASHFPLLSNSVIHLLAESSHIRNAGIFRLIGLYFSELS